MFSLPEIQLCDIPFRDSNLHGKNKRSLIVIFMSNNIILQGVSTARYADGLY